MRSVNVVNSVYKRTKWAVGACKKKLDKLFYLSVQLRYEDEKDKDKDQDKEKETRRIP